MKIHSNQLLLCIIFCLLFTSCHKDQPIFPNEIERVQMISFRYLFEGGSNEPNDIKIVLDSTFGTYTKRKDYDTTKPYLDPSFNISSSLWNSLFKSFDMDSIIPLKNYYSSAWVDEGERTVEIQTTLRYKKIIYHTSNFFPFDSSSEIKPLDSLNNYLWEVWRMYINEKLLKTFILINSCVLDMLKC